jgi:hypothetical protein
MHCGSTMRLAEYSNIGYPQNNCDTIKTYLVFVARLALFLVSNCVYVCHIVARAVWHFRVGKSSHVVIQLASSTLIHQSLPSQILYTTRGSKWRIAYGVFIHVEIDLSNSQESEPYALRDLSDSEGLRHMRSSFLHFRITLIQNTPPNSTAAPVIEM